MDIEWPANEPIPQNIDDALARGWEVGSSDGEVSDDERITTGTMDLEKWVGDLLLKMEIPFQSTTTFGKPFIKRASLQIPSDSDEQLESLESLASEQGGN